MGDFDYGQCVCGWLNSELELVGSILNWNWMCDPTGKPDSHRYGRGSRRVIFFLLGIVLIVTSIMSWVL